MPAAAPVTGRVKRFVLFLKKQPPGRLIVLGFALVILLGTGLLLLPVSVRDDVQVSFIDALFTSTSAVCVTGLIAIDVADHFTAFGQTIVAALIQIGGLGVTSIGVGLILAAGKRVSFKGRTLVKEALNVDGFKGMVRLVKAVLLMTLCFELVGMALSFIVFVQDYPPLRALGISAFHSIAAFNNSGFDILGGLRNMIPYQSDILLNLTTCGLIIFGGLGFLVILDILKKRSFKKLMLHSKIVIITTVVLIVAGTLLLKATEDVSWLGAFFQSVSARTAGFSHLSHRGIYQRRALHAHHPDVYRRFPRLHRRRYQNQHLFRPDTAGTQLVYQKTNRCFPPQHFSGNTFQILNYCPVVPAAGLHRDLPAVYFGAGMQLCPAAV